MTIAIDYDDTYTKDPELWDVVIQLCRDRGHDVFGVTCRKGSTERITAPEWGLSTIYTNRRPKLEVIKNMNLTIDIWIDDDPFSIVDTF